MTLTWNQMILPWDLNSLKDLGEWMFLWMKNTTYWFEADGEDLETARGWVAVTQRVTRTALPTQWVVLKPVVTWLAL